MKHPEKNTPSLLQNYTISHYFTQPELYQLEQLLMRKTFKAGEFISRENTSTHNFFFIQHGSVEILKKIHGKQRLLSQLHQYDSFGELSYLDSRECSHSVKAEQTVEVLVLKKEDFEQLGEAFHYLQHKFFSHLSLDKLEKNEQQLADEILLRIKFGKFVIAIILGFCLFISFLEFYEDLLAYAHYYVIGACAFIIGGGLCLYIIKHMREPLSAFGVSLKNWQQSISEGLIISILLLISAQLIWSDINFIEAVYSPPYLFFYLIIVYLQEFIFRGVTITAFEKFYDSTGYAVLITAFLFGILHIHHGLIVFILSFIMGLLLGLLFIRHKNLLGITIIHLCLGNIATTIGIMQQYPM